MATTDSEDTRQHQIIDLASAEESISTSRETASLSGIEKLNTCARMRSIFHCRCQRCCVSSKAALLILLWNLILAAVLEVFLIQTQILESRSELMMIITQQ